MQRSYFSPVFLKLLCLPKVINGKKRMFSQIHYLAAKIIGNFEKVRNGSTGTQIYLT